MGAIDGAVLRELVRDAVREAIWSFGAPQIERVEITSDADLAKFVGKIVTLLDDPGTAAMLRRGELQFRVGRTDFPIASVADSPQPPTAPLTGVIGEKAIARFSSEAEIYLGVGAVVTPAARDRAREKGITFVRRLPC